MRMVNTKEKAENLDCSKLQRINFLNSLDVFVRAKFYLILIQKENSEWTYSFSKLS